MESYLKLSANPRSLGLEVFLESMSLVQQPTIKFSRR